MPTGRSILKSVLLLLLACSLLASCGQATPTAVAPEPEATASPTSDAYTSPVEGASDGSSTLDSPLAEPERTSAVIIVQPETPIPTGTPDPDYTPVAIVQVELTPEREVITIQNVSSDEQDISSWILFNLNNEPSFRFPEGLVLQPGESVQVHSGIPEGDVPGGALFWTRDRIWFGFPAEVMLLNSVTRLMYRYTAHGDQ